MNSTLSTRIVLASVTALALLGCGGAPGSSTATTTATVGSAGATLSTALVAVAIPPGAVGSTVAVTVREAEPHHQGRVARIELEPRGLALGQPAVVSVQVDDSNARVRIIGVDDSTGQEHLMEVEVEDQAHHRYKTTVSRLGSLEVELEHLQSCSPGCAASEECDDGVCKPHLEAAGAATCSAVCASGMECDDGACQPHGGAAAGSTTPGATGTAVACGAGCASGLECDDGICKPHGGAASGGGTTSGSGTSAGTGTTGTGTTTGAGTGAVATCTPACATGLECDNGVCKPHGGNG